MSRPGALLLAIALRVLASPDCRAAEAFAPVADGASSSPRASSPRASSPRASSFLAVPSLRSPRPAARRRGWGPSASRRVAFADVDETESIPAFDPLGCGDGRDWDDATPVVRRRRPNDSEGASLRLDPGGALGPPLLALSALVLGPSESSAAGATTPLSTGEFNPDSFRPVCSASDSFYRLLQGSTRAVVGDENFREYGPLIAGGLLRIRLELCVVESFFNEAVGPFVRENGLSWILPLHETVETFLAGTIFALATTFILVGSTKLIQIIAFYGDLVVGGPCRLLGGFFFDRARGEPVTLDVSLFGFFKTRLVGPPVDFEEEEARRASGEEKLLDFDKVEPKDVPLLAASGGVKVVGEASKLFREFIEGLDLFVGRYLVLIASGYILLKFVHFKVFPDFP